MTKSVASLLIGAAVLAASACGDGGGVIWRSHAESVPLAQPLRNLPGGGFQKTFSVTGRLYPGAQSVPVTGSVRFAVSGFHSATLFNGREALSSTTTINGTLEADGRTIPIAIERQSFVTNDYAPLGSESPGQYCVVTSWTQLPVSIEFDATVPYNKSACYTDSTRATPIGTGTMGYYTKYGTGAFDFAVLQAENMGWADVLVHASDAITYLETGFLVDTSGGIGFNSFDLSATVDGVDLLLAGCESACWD